MQFIDGVLHIGGVPVTGIVERFGSPVYVYDAAVLRRQVERVKHAFASMPFRPFFAMKANSNTSILRLIREAGFGCDAVSPGEIHIAMKAGYTPDEIWFTCSNVSDADLRAIPDPRIVINVNSMSEVDRLLSLDIPNPVALRLNPDVGAGHHKDVITAGGGVKFGIDIAEILSARMVLEDSGRKVVGIHAHIGSGVDTIDPLVHAARRLLEIVPEFRHLRFVNFGGGFGVPYRPGDPEFPIEEYGAALSTVAGTMLRARDLVGILEPGRYVVAQAGTLLAQVTSKRMSGGMTWAGVDSGFNHLIRPSKYGAYHHILNASRGSDASLRATYDSTAHREKVVVAGNLCESGDLFTRQPDGPPLPRPVDETHVGDILAFCDAGAYGFSMASNYNSRLLPPEVMIDGGEVRLIRERQTYDDLLKGMS